MTENKDWQGEDDCRALERAAEIHGDRKRLSGAKKVAAKKLAALKKVAGGRAFSSRR